MGPVYSYPTSAAMLYSQGVYGQVRSEEPLTADQVFDMMLRKETDKSAQMRDGVKHVKAEFNQYNYSRAMSSLALMNQMSAQMNPPPAAETENPGQAPEGADPGNAAPEGTASEGAAPQAAGSQAAAPQAAGAVRPVAAS
ncbi:MAG: hypothetical protein RDV48_10510 [Candidatus Eremiobacteraeota bacterium]|nr:hypothetical protein [Candidatus Eremiobacteraeota bacterium]